MRKDRITEYLKSFRDDVINGFEALETGGKFERKPWSYEKGEGGGEISLIRGEVFEKAAVNWSGVQGSRLPQQREESEATRFFATGVSIITHMTNPKAPTVHMNIRYIETEKKWWLGGGFDLTPMGFPSEDDTRHFHSVAERALKPFGSELYSQFSRAARDYFWIRHYQRERGVGGIFFDHYNTGDFDQDFAMWKSVGNHFLEAILPIYERRINEPFVAEDKHIQLRRRAHYVEFNLLYDRGTQFGFQSGGNPEAILCSMPPLAAW